MQQVYKGIIFTLHEFVWIGQVGLRRPADDLFVSETSEGWTYMLGRVRSTGQTCFASFEEAVDSALARIAAAREEPKPVRQTSWLSSLLMPIGAITAITVALVGLQQVMLK